MEFFHGICDRRRYIVEEKLQQWRHGVVVISTAQLHSTKPELRFCAVSKPARGVLVIRDGGHLRQSEAVEKRCSYQKVF